MVETITVIVTSALLLGIQLILVDGVYLLRQWFWVDEWFTWLEVSSPGFGQLWITYAVSESNPPLYQIVTWAASSLAGGASELVLRSISLASTFVALVGLYFILRRTFTTAVSVATLLCLWSLPSVQFHAFDARYYAMWLACVVWFVWCVDRAVSLGEPSGLSLGVSAFALCAVYLLGIVVLAVVVTVAIAMAWRGCGGVGRRVRDLAPALAGGLCAVPLLVWSMSKHGAAFEAASWTEPVSFRLAVAYLNGLLVPPQLAVAAVAVGASWIVRRTLPSPDRRTSHSRMLLLSLAALPALLLAVSTVGPPLTMERYGFPAIVTSSVIAATLLAQSPRAAVIVCAVVWLGQSTLGLKRSVEFNRTVDAQSAALIESVRAITGRGEMVVFESVQQYSLLDRYSPDLRDRVSLLDFERRDVRSDMVASGALREGVEVRLFERDLARQVVPVIGRPRMIGIAMLRTARARVWLITRRDDEPLVWEGAHSLQAQGRVARVEFTP